MSQDTLPAISRYSLSAVQSKPVYNPIVYSMTSRLVRGDSDVGTDWGCCWQYCRCGGWPIGDMDVDSKSATRRTKEFHGKDGCGRLDGSGRFLRGTTVNTHSMERVPVVGLCAWSVYLY